MAASAACVGLRLAIPRLSSSPILLSYFNKQQPLLHLSSPPSPSSSSFTRRLFCTSSPSPLVPVIQQQLDVEQPKQIEANEQTQQEPIEEIQSYDEEEQTEPIMEEVPPLPKLPTPKLSVKERKELASFAHGLGKKLKIQQVGKSGVTQSVAASFVENLESNELLKLKVHGSCPGELIDVIKQLEEATGSVAVDQIGRSVILYRPSLRKLKKKVVGSPRRPKEFPAFKVQERRYAPRAYGQEHRRVHSA